MLPPGMAQEPGAAGGQEALAEWGLFILHNPGGGHNPSLATQSPLNPGGTMHCSHSSGNKINIFSPKDPTMGLFHGRESETVP